MANEQKISVYVAYAFAQDQEIICVELAANSTVEQAINKSLILQKHSEINLDDIEVGIYGKIVQNTQPLHDQDRVEIYRPLTMDPMHARRMRAGI
ncbi:MAG: RnfH family protein [Gammaproteobacteria bacterium]